MNLDNHSESELASDISDKKVQDLLIRIEKNNGIVGLLVVTQKNWHFWIRQIFIGVCRGFGFSLGGTIVISIVVAIIYNTLDFFNNMINIPYLTDLIKKIIEILKEVH